MDVDKVPAFLSPKWQWVFTWFGSNKYDSWNKKISVDINKIVLTKTVTGSIMLQVKFDFRLIFI